MSNPRIPFPALCLLLCLTASLPAVAAGFHAGTARMDITPDHPVRLSGYAARQTEATNATQRLYAKALALRQEHPHQSALLITVDNCAVPSHIRQAVLDRLSDLPVIHSDNFTIASSHTHTAPALTGALPNLFVQDLPEDEVERIDRYTQRLIRDLETVARQALRSLQPVSLSLGYSQAGFAANRRTPGGPVDHSVPVLQLRDASGKLVAVLANYACHCTTLGAGLNEHCGDWAGYAQEKLEQDHPGALAMVTIGCGADANPHPRGSLELSKQHGTQLAEAVSDVLRGGVKPVRGNLTTRSRLIQLPFEPLPDRAEWEQRAAQPGIVGYHARKNLERLDKGRSLPTHLPYLIQTWTIGDDLAFVFLPGEVVVDYALALKEQLDPQRLFLTAYANDVPCYIPSRRILEEGGYEAESSLWYYDQPARLQPAVQDQILRTVADLLPPTFNRDSNHSRHPPPLSPADALASLRSWPGLAVELVASEPLIIDPVAIDFDLHGRLWVAEMNDYPAGKQGAYEPGGRIKLLTDTNQDGAYDHASLFLDEIPFPTDLMVWNKGLLICAAPDILYAVDTDEDGRADTVTKLFSGFATHNYQARLNSLRLGLDGWIYGSGGLFGGEITGIHQPSPVSILNQDFRLSLDLQTIQPAAGRSQQGRVRNDWNEWFGCDNSHWIWHYPVPDHYLQRRPDAPFPSHRVYLPDADHHILRPISTTLERFNDPAHAQRITSACGLEIYRDIQIPALQESALICEPVHSLVRSLPLSSASLIPQIKTNCPPQEFLASTDNWFRPAQIRTGPDGAVWVVDMYRFVIEHPRWISEERLAELDVRAGSDKGRIYRIRIASQDTPPHPWAIGQTNLPENDPARWIRQLDHPNGTWRDMMHQHLLHLTRPSPPQTSATHALNTSATPPPDSAPGDILTELRHLARHAVHPAARAQALAILSDHTALDPALLAHALADSHPLVQVRAVQLSENSTCQTQAVARAIQLLLHHPHPKVLQQIAFTLGAWPDELALPLLEQTMLQPAASSWTEAALLTSAGGRALPLFRRLSRNSPDFARTQFAASLLKSALDDVKNPATRESLIDLLSAEDANSESHIPLDTRFQLAAALLETHPALHPPPIDLDRLLPHAVGTAMDAQAPLPARRSALQFIGASAAHLDVPPSPLRDWIRTPAADPELRQPMLEAAGRFHHPTVAQALIEAWKETAASRTAIGLSLLSRPTWRDAFITSIHDGRIHPDSLPLPLRSQLLQSHRTALPDDLAKALALSAEQAAGMEQRLARVTQLEADPDRGRILYQQACASCHRFNNLGTQLGPDLDALTDYSPRALLTAILQPAAAIEDRYQLHQLQLIDGRTLQGMIQEENTARLQLAQVDGTILTIPKNTIKQRTVSPLSLMPEGFGDALSDQDLADLLHYLHPH